jgi:hypothetical protein
MNTSINKTEAKNEGDGSHDEGGDNNHHVLNHEYQYYLNRG